MAYTQSQIDSQYQLLGACPGGVAGTYLQFPQGFQWCASDADMQVLIGQKGFFNSKNPYDPRSSGPSLLKGGGVVWNSAPDQISGKPPLSSSGNAAVAASSSSLIDSAMAWVSNNKLMAAGIAAAGIWLAVKK